jgi:hypothetical protein
VIATSPLITLNAELEKYAAIEPESTDNVGVAVSVLVALDPPSNNIPLDGVIVLIYVFVVSVPNATELACMVAAPPAAIRISPLTFANILSS